MRDESFFLALASRTLLGFTQYTFPEYETSEFNKDLCERLDRFLRDIIEGKNPRLMIFAPPQHGKSEIVSRRFPAYILGRFPDWSIITCSYSSDLSARMNRDVQRIIDDSSYTRIFPGTRLSGRNVKTIAYGSYLRNSDVFEIVNRKGFYRSSGVGGGITGMGMNIGIIDDPIKDAAEAYSATIRENIWNWYQTTFQTRVRKGAGILLTLTRWHIDDLAGRLEKVADSQGWEIVSYPAIAEKDEFGRKPGEALDENRQSLTNLLQIKSGLSSPHWASLYQQRPTPIGGNIVNLSWFRRYSILPIQFKMIVQSWDTASKAQEINNPSACTTWGITPEGKIYLLDVLKKRMEYPELKRIVPSLAAKWNPNAILIEDKSSGEALIQDLRGSTNLPIIPIEPVGDKITRMLVETPVIESGNVYLPIHATWLPDYEIEISSFPNSDKDQTDSTSQFFGWHRKKFVKFEFTGSGDIIGGVKQSDYEF